MTYAIEKGVPLPPTRRYGRPAVKLTLLAMDVGDSTLIPDRTSVCVSTAAHRLHADTGWRWTVQRQKDGSGVRVWRVE